MTTCPKPDTICREVYTKCPKTPVKTECPWGEDSATSCPPPETNPTDCPKPDPTKCPEYTVETKCPEKKTECVEEPEDSKTECPYKGTECPETPKSTECPKGATHCPVIATECPKEISRTSCPEGRQSTTTCPKPDTTCPVTPTKCPAPPTNCNKVPTTCPKPDTVCHEAPTTCPSEANKVSTTCPKPDPTKCVYTNPTNCPNYENTKCPYKLTECPNPESTKCPEEVTKCPKPNPTKCPEASTTCPGPKEDTKCRNCEHDSTSDEEYEIGDSNLPVMRDSGEWKNCGPAPNGFSYGNSDTTGGIHGQIMLQTSNKLYWAWCCRKPRDVKYCVPKNDDKEKMAETTYDETTLKAPYKKPGADESEYKHVEDKYAQRLCQTHKCAWQTYVGYILNEITPQCYWRCEGMGKYSSPILVDVFGLGYPDLLAGKEWRKDRAYKVSQSAFRFFNLDLSVPKLWEWVGPKSGILVYWKASDPKDIPSALDGSSLFGNHTFGRTWKNGYEALASLDGDKDGQIAGGELTHLWIWVDANSNALVDPGEAKAAVSYVKALNTKATLYPSGDAEAPKGAMLQSGAMVPSWDWWSVVAPVGSIVVQGELPKVYYSPKVVGTAPATAKVYIWGMKGKMLGLLRFVTVGSEQYVVSLPFGTDPELGFFPAMFSKVHHAPGKLDWRFIGGLGNLTELAFVTGTPSQLLGENARDGLGEDKTVYSWKAEVLTGTVDEWVGAYVRAVAGFQDEELVAAIAAVGDIGKVRLLAGVDISGTKFVPLNPF